MRLDNLVFTDNREALKYCKKHVNQKHGRMSLVAGHHPLIYRDTQNCLVPLTPKVALHEDASEAEHIHLNLFGEQAEETLRAGIEIIRSRTEDNVFLSILVNDHFFQSFQGDMFSGEKLAQLKRRYYRENDPLPEFILQALGESGLDLNVVEKNFNRDRQKDSTLPKECYQFSENVLRSRFCRIRISEISQNPRVMINNGFPSSIEYSNAEFGIRSSLLDNRGDCGCSGEVIEFLHYLKTVGSEHVIMFIPNECRKPVLASSVFSQNEMSMFSSLLVLWCDFDLSLESSRGYPIVNFSKGVLIEC